MLIRNLPKALISAIIAVFWGELRLFDLLIRLRDFPILSINNLDNSLLLKRGQEIGYLIELLLFGKGLRQFIFKQSRYLLSCCFPKIGDIVNDEFLEIIIIKAFVLNIGDVFSPTCFDCLTTEKDK